MIVGEPTIDVWRHGLKRGRFDTQEVIACEEPCLVDFLAQSGHILVLICQIGLRFTKVQAEAIRGRIAAQCLIL